MKGYFLRLGIGFVTIFSLISDIAADAILNNCNETQLRAAMGTGGLIIFNCDGTIVLGNPLLVTEDTVLDAREHNVTISGSDAVRLFTVVNDRRLTLYNLTLTRGMDQGTNGAPGQPGGSAGGGAILLQGGELYADGCRFLTNRAVGGHGGNGTNSPPPPVPIGPRAGGNGRGGAIFAETATVTLTNCIFRANSSAGGAGGASASLPVIFAAAGTGDGGALWINGGNLSAQVCQFERDSASSLGGGIHLTGSEGTVERCAFNQNSAGAAGGAIYYSGPLSNQRFLVVQSAFHRNTSSRGGGILHADGNLGLAGCTLNENSAAGQDGFYDMRTLRNGGHGEGGGICSVAGSLFVSESTFSANHAQGGRSMLAANPGSGSGGGLYSRGALTIVQNCTFVNNQAVAGGWWPGEGFPLDTIKGEGGGIFVTTGSTMRISFSTIASNMASGPTNLTIRGGGYANVAGTLILESSILSGNTTNGAFGGNGFGSVAGSAGGINLSSDTSVPFSQVNVDPRILPLADNGGPVPTMALRRNSPAIDTSTSPNQPWTDARGVRRPQRNGLDIGAYEQTFLAIEEVTTSVVRFRYAAPPLERYALEVSLDLNAWNELQTYSSDNTGTLVFDLPALPLSEMFRLRLIP